MTSFWEPEPRRSNTARWIAFAIAVFLVFAVVGGSAAIATDGHLDLSAFGIGRPVAAAGPATASPEKTAGSAEPSDPAGSPGSSASSPGSSRTPGAGGTPAASASPAATASPGRGDPVVTGSVDPRLSARLQKALENARKRLVLPGVSATVVFPDGSTWTGVAGYAVPSTKRAVRPETPFAIASVTKTFTAALILRLAEQGKLHLNDPLSKYVPDYPDAPGITISMLLRQTSGLQDYFQDPKVDRALNKSKTKVWTPQTVLAFDRTYFDTVVYRPGVGWHYSNTNYLLLGLVAEKAGGASWATLVRRELLDPLGLTSVSIQGSEPPTAPPAHANRMYTGSGNKLVAADLTDGTDLVPFTSVVTAAWSAGAIASDSRDLAVWAKALYSGKVLKLASRRLMLTFDPKIAQTYATAYGMGVSKVRIEGLVAYGHQGALAGTRAAIRWFPKQKVAISALFNRDGLLVGDDVIRYLVKVLYPKPAASPSPRASQSP